MNRKVLYIIFCFTAMLQIRGFSQTYEWTQNIGSSMMSQVQTLEADEDGNSYITGNISGNVTLGGTTYNLASSSLLIAKLDSAGNFLWSKVVEGSIYATEISLDQDRNLFIIGSAYGSPINFDGNTLTSASGQMYFLAKYDQAGTIQWVKSEDGFFGTLVSADFNGNANISLTFTGSRDIEGTTYTSGVSGTVPSLFHLQYDSAGVFQWIDQIDLVGPVGWGHFFPQGMVSDASGNTYTVGMYSQGSMVHGTDTLPFSSDSADFFMVKYDQLGNYQWGQTAVGLNTQVGSAVDVDPSGNIYVAGSLSDSASFGGIPLSMGSSQTGYFVVKFDPQGNGIWGLAGTGSSHVYGTGITVNQLGESYTMGYYAGSFTVGGQTLTSLNNQTNAFIVKHDASGTPIWSQKAGDNPNGGSTYGTDISGNGSADIYLGAFAADGTIFGSLSTSTSSSQDWGTIARLTDTTYVPPFPLDSIWPGDANYDLIANNFDLLSIGVGYGNTGPVRPNASNNWVAQPGYDWSLSLASGVNYKHIDCNGDGIIDIQDTMAISLNYGLTHNKTDITEEMGAPLYTEFLVDSAFVGDTVNMAIMLGNDSMPASMIYGLAFTINLDTTLIDPSSVMVSYDSSWFGDFGVDMLALHRNFPADGKLEMAITGIDQIDRSGYGEIARISIIMIDDITAKKYFTKSLKATITNHYVIDRNEVVQPIAIGQDSLTLLQEDTTGTNNTAIDQELAKKVSIYPNPASEELQISLDGINGKGYYLSDLAGRTVLMKEKLFIREKVSLEAIPQGIYLMTIQTDKGNIVRKIMIE
ncbi:MAG: T9SS type A sorting domain-containing protein [Bacteroidetes bacterium]|nr:T9SS type A sorting domain-containing protein [Bacteroidota bacterium]MCB0842505.1 T9SS type A sorting domain-containing protein [Bacteroidota bacterium]